MSGKEVAAYLYTFAHKHVGAGNVLYDFSMTSLPVDRCLKCLDVNYSIEGMFNL